jgi:Domain of unknown function (DUF4279)
MTRPNEYRAYFNFVGEFDPAEVTTQVSLQPSRSWRKGEINPSTQQERKHSRWCVDSRLSETESLERHVADVLEQLRPRAEAVAQLRSKLDGGLQLVGNFYRDYPGFGLDDVTVAELSKMKLGFDCDFYFLYSDKREDSN